MNAIAIAANVSDERGLERVEVHYLLRAKPNKVGDPDPNLSYATFVAGPTKAGGAKALAYKASIDLIQHDKLLNGNFTSWTLEYWVVATDTGGNVGESKPNADVTVFSICGPI